MKARTRKAIDRMLTRAIPTAPLDVRIRWCQRLTWVRLLKNPRKALREARKLVVEAQPLMKPYEVAAWMKL
jgi:hypothetical protein